MSGEPGNLDFSDTLPSAVGWNQAVLGNVEIVHLLQSPQQSSSQLGSCGNW